MSHKKTAWSAVSIFLLLMLASLARGEAGPEQQQEVERAREERIAANVPQTPEALLQVFKDLLANPDVDGHEFCEQRLGIDRRSWRKSILEKSLEKELLGPFDKYPPAPFQFTEAALDHQGKLRVLVLWLFENPNFPLNPALTRQIMGEPEVISVSGPDTEISRGSYRLWYHYSTNKYKLAVVFRNVDEEANDKTVVAFRNHTPEQIRQEQEYRRSFAVHKDYRPFIIELHRFERP